MKLAGKFFSVITMLCVITATAADLCNFENLTAAQDAGWATQGGADLQLAKATDGHNCLQAIGNGKSRYGGLRFSRSLDLGAAGAGDFISFSIKQNIGSSIYVLISTNSGNFSRICKITAGEWDKVNLDLNIANWTSAKGDKPSIWGKADVIAIYNSDFSQNGQYMMVSDFKLTIADKELVEKSMGIRLKMAAKDAKDNEIVKFLRTEKALWAINTQNGGMAGAWKLNDSKLLLKWCETSYYIQAKSGDKTGSEKDDHVTKISNENGGLNFVCTNSALPDLEIIKRYWIERNSLRRKLFFKNLGKSKIFLTVNTETVFTPDFRNDSYYLGAGFIGPLIPAPREKSRIAMTKYRTTTKGMVLSNPADKGSFANYRTELNGKFVFPWWQSANVPTYHEKYNVLHYTPDGWDMSLGTVDMIPGSSFSYDDTFVFFNGNWFDFLCKVYPEDPVVAKNLKSIAPIPEWLKDVRAYVDLSSIQDIKRMAEMTDDGYIMVIISREFGNWGDYRAENGFDGFFGGKITGPELKDIIRKVKAISPRVKVAIYNWITSVGYESPLFKEHPEWFKTKDRNGNESMFFPGLCLNYATMINRPECFNFMRDQFKKMADYLDADFIYLDETKTTNTIKWETEELTRDDHWYELWKSMKEQLSKDNKALFFNGRGMPYGDINFIEACTQLEPKYWREFSGMGLGVEAFLTQRPGARISPLYWIDKADYINRVLAMGWIPATEVFGATKVFMLPFIRAAYEVGDCTPVDAVYSPDWKTDSKTDIESYSMRRIDGNDILFSFINRGNKPRPVPVSINLGSLGISPERHINIWEYKIDSIKAEDNNVFSDKESRDNLLHYNWRNNLITAPSLIYSGNAVGVININIAKLDADELRQLVVTDHPAGIYATNNLPGNYFFSSQKGVQIVGYQMPLKVKSELNNVKIILFDQQKTFDKITVNDISIKPEWIVLGGAIYPVIALGKGESIVNAEQIDIPATQTALKVEAEFKDGVIKLKGNSVGKTLVAVLHGNKTIYSGVPENNTIPIPEKRTGGNYSVYAAAELGNAPFVPYAPEQVTLAIPKGKTSDAFKMVGDFKRYPAQRNIHPVNKEIDGVTLLEAASEVGPWVDKKGIQEQLEPRMAKSMPEQLKLVAGTTRKIEDFFGYAFAGFKIKNARTVKLKLDNTFYNTFTSEVERYTDKYRRSTREFAGIIIDYHTAAGFVKRVALSVGVLNKKCNITAPTWGKANVPDQFVNLGDIIEQGPSKTFALNLAEYAPKDWDGIVWFSAGSDWITPGCILEASILGFNDQSETQYLSGIDPRKTYAEYMQPKQITIPFIPFVVQTPLSTKNLDSPDWLQGAKVTPFYLLGGNGYPKLPTFARIMYDTENLYIGVMCKEVRNKPVSGGSIWNSDEVEIWLQPPSQKVTQILIDSEGANAVNIDGHLQNKEGLQVKSKIVAGSCWYVFVTIPFRWLGVTPPVSGDSPFKFNIVRCRVAGDGFPEEISTWAPLREGFNEPGNFGVLNFGQNTDKSKVINLGEGGLSSKEILNKKLPCALILKPQLTVLLAGTNDMLWPEKMASYESYEKNMRQIITELKEAGSKVMLITLPPCSEKLLFLRHKPEAFGKATPSERVIKANEIIRRLASDEKCQLVDFYQIAQQRGDVDCKTSLIQNLANGGGEDGVHPRAEGYKVMADEIFTVIENERLPTEKIICLGDSITYGAGMKGKGTATGETYPGQLAELLSKQFSNQNIK